MFKLNQFDYYIRYKILRVCNILLHLFLQVRIKKKIVDKIMNGILRVNINTYYPTDVLSTEGQVYYTTRSLTYTCMAIQTHLHKSHKYIYF